MKDRTISFGNLPENDDGSAVLEMGATLPIMFGLMFCFLELCLGFYSHSMISECAREGTRYAMYRGASCPTTANPTCEATAAQVNSYVTGLAWPNLARGTMTVATTYPAGNELPGNTVQVTVTYVLGITLPYVPKSALTMTSTSVETIIQ